MNLDEIYFFYKSGILDEKSMKTKGPSKLFRKSQVSKIQKEHKLSKPIKLISLNEYKESFELNRLCMIDFLNPD